MEVKVGDYVRTKTGIHKVFGINENATVYEYYCDKKPTGDWDGSYEYIRIREDEIIGQPSNDITDLIQVGDYVNGGLVAFVGSDSIEIFWYKDEMEWLGKDDIITIVTKEQFESMKYKID